MKKRFKFRVRGLKFYGLPIVLKVEVVIEGEKKEMKDKMLKKKIEQGIHMLFMDVEAEGRQEIMKTIHKSIDRIQEIK